MPRHPAHPVSPCGSSPTPSTRRSPVHECADRGRWSSCRPRTGPLARRRAGEGEASLQVVELLPELLELAFHCDDGLRDGRIVGLRPDGVDLAQQLLPEEPELFPHGPVGRKRLPARGQVGPQPHELLRSEEHTSELQSRPHLVCRLLLEKKKKKRMVCEGFYKKDKEV